MLPSRRVSRVLLLVASAAILDRSATAAPAYSKAPGVAFALPRAGASVRGGDIIEVRWAGVDDSADEVELLLSVDGGRHFDLRLTEELDADSSSFLWRVPNLTAGEACLAIRAGVAGRESTSAPGPLFRIAPDASLPALPLSWRGGELWVGVDARLESARREAPLSGLAAGEEGMTALADTGPAFDLPRSAPLDPAGPAHHLRRDSPAVPAAASFPDELPRAPLSIPPRI